MNAPGVSGLQETPAPRGPHWLVEVQQPIEIWKLVHLLSAAAVGVTELLAAEAGLVTLIPADVAVAVTVNVYAVPAVKLVTTIGLENPAVEKPPGEDNAV